MINPAFIVDGYMERAIIENICPNHPIRLLECNGRNVSYDAAGKKAASLIRLLDKYYPIIMIFDRENRSDNFYDVAKNLRNSILVHGIQEVDLFIGIPDRMVENWILADTDAIKSYYNMSRIDAVEVCEGHNGKSKIKQIIGSNAYSETEDGPAIFKKCNHSLMYEKIQSFKSFIDNLLHLKCRWFQAILDSAH